MSSADVSIPTIQDTFGVEFRQQELDFSQMVEDASARETLEALETKEDTESIFAITHAVNEINKLVKISRTKDGETEELIDLFTAQQLVEMYQRMHEYLGGDIDEFTAEGARAVNYSYFVNRLGMYFTSHDTSVTTNFSEFEKRHTDPSQNATGPLEHNSRRYANYAKEMILKNLATYYQTGFDIELYGPTKVVNGQAVWGRGVAESQFLILDYIAVQAAQGFERRVRLPNSVVTMTIEDIGANIASLLERRSSIYSRSVQINPLIAFAIDEAIGQLNEYTKEVLHRGRWGALQYEREPRKAQREIMGIQALLRQAISLEYVQGEEEIPVLDLDDLLGE